MSPYQSQLPFLHKTRLGGAVPSSVGAARSWPVQLFSFVYFGLWLGFQRICFIWALRFSSLSFKKSLLSVGELGGSVCIVKCSAGLCVDSTSPPTSKYSHILKTLQYKINPLKKVQEFKKCIQIHKISNCF